jgi:hypothetical protein
MIHEPTGLDSKPIEKERQDFEDYAFRHSWDTSIRSDGSRRFADPQTQCAWIAWADRAALVKPLPVEAIEEAASIVYSEAMMLERSAYEHPSDSTGSLLERSTLLQGYAAQLRDLIQGVQS